MAYKIADTITHIETLETKVQKELHEQAVRLENNNEELHVKWKKVLKDIYRQIVDHWSNDINTIKHEKDSKIHDVHDQVNVNANKLCELETRRNLI